MNINLNVPVSLMERIAMALEKIAWHAERLVPPEISLDPRPYPSTDWMESSNALSREIEAEEAREAEGFGPEYERELESAVFNAPNSSDTASR